MQAALKSRTTRALFLSPTKSKTDGSRLYRCHFQAKQLERAGLRADVSYVADTTVKQAVSADILVFSRCYFQPHTVQLVKAAQAAGRLVCADLDDKLYAPWDVEQMGSQRSELLVRGYAPYGQDLAEGQRSRLHLLPLFDHILVSTPALRDELTALGFRAHVARNAFDTDVAAPIARVRTGLRRIIVMAGTKTHDADVRTVSRPLARFLHENPAIECSFLGPLEPAAVLRGLPNLKRHKLVPMHALPAFIAEHDLCLVPLEDTSFNDCKSAIKLVECGLASVPVIASPRRELRELISHGENGFLCDDTDDGWYRLLCTLRDQPALLQRVAAAAHESALREHTVESRGRSLADLLLTLASAKNRANEMRGIRP